MVAFLFLFIAPFLMATAGFKSTAATCFKSNRSITGNKKGEATASPFPCCFYGYLMIVT